MIKRIVVEYAGMEFGNETKTTVVCKVDLDARHFDTDQDRKDFAHTVDGALSVAIAKWELSR